VGRIRHGAGLGRDLWVYVLLLAATIAVYGQVHSHGFLNFDDPDYVTANPHVRNGLTAEGVTWALTSVQAANWFPLTWISHMLDCQFFGLRPGWHHLTNLAIHALTTLLLLAVLRRLTGARLRSAFVAFVFAIHPLHVESVAWIAERKDVLSALFWVLTMWAYVRYVERPDALRYALVILMFCGGLMSKPMIVTLPFVLLLLDFWPLDRAKGRRFLLEKLPLLALSIGASLITYFAQQHGGAVLSAVDLPLSLRIENALISSLTYIGQLIWPANLAVFYPYPSAIPAWQALAAGLAMAAVTVLVLGPFRRQPYLAVGWLWYLLTLAPVIGIVQVGLQSHADRYTYIPMIGIAILLAWGFPPLFERVSWGRPALAALAAAACIGWAAVTFINLRYWESSITLFRHATVVTSGNYVAYNDLGAALRHEGRNEEAIGNFKAALAVRPEFPSALTNLGEALLAEGQIDEAIPAIEEALRLQPDLAEAHIDLGAAFSKRNRLEEAEKQYAAAVQLQPESPQAQAGLGVILNELNHPQDALPHLLAAVQDEPEYADAHYNLGRVFGLLGRNADAAAQFAEAIRLRPDDPQAHFNLGIALASEQQFNRALDEFRTAIRLKPDYAGAHFNLGATLATLGQYRDAAAEFSAVIRLQPDFPGARQNLRYSLDLLRNNRE
jgi:tetratricopeptide (TPR) repeat protein